MKHIRLRTRTTVFILFFGIPMLDAIRSGIWVDVAFWIVLAAIFLYADNLQQHTKADQR